MIKDPTVSVSPDNTTFNTDELNFDDFQLEDFDTPAATAPTLSAERDLSFFKNIPVTVTLEVASKEVPLGDLMKAGEGSIIELDKLNGEPLDVKVNGTLMGHAEVVVINEKYGLRLIDVLDTALSGVGK
ncbi:flagellar motor switch protein FliN [Vibrio sp. SM6]|uniref:Flagellar motor switch protein FliN n=1 Tax=Vibrio agarilyticus TaxID=2726741 RepID=A0A7X8YHP1_9VIBR|nr:flagellar motor switch protein FliN [Vibrio agarilyticus]NLS13706.1 flagellar motor switch protein FliN [Vibrio agarilyticus]